MTAVIIKAVKAIAEDQGFKTLKITGRKRVVFHPADWIAGVDYEDPPEDENQAENEDDDAAYNDTDAAAEDDPNEDDLEDTKEYYQIDQAELDKLLADPAANIQDLAPTPNNGEAPAGDDSAADTAALCTNRDTQASELR